MLIIEANEGWKAFLSRVLSSTYRIIVCQDEETIFKRLQKEVFGTIILDLQSIRSSKLKFLQKVKEMAPNAPIITTSEEERADLIVKIVKAGAFDFVVKPYSETKIRLAVDHAVENRSLKNELDYLRRQQDVVYNCDQIIAVSPPMQRVISMVRKLAGADSTILITGETGTGKSFISGTIHFNSPRKSKPFVKINCANIPDTLLESELFGHEKGTFTGADKMRVGRLEQADGGTVFLDEIGELNPALQAKLLRVIEEKAFERLGGNQTIHSDIRIIAATNRNIEEQVTSGVFREDLYYRINVLRLHMPPLRERRECIIPLAHHLLGRILQSFKKHISGFSPEVLKILTDYSWPGNIRELSNTIERAVLLEEQPTIQKENIFLPGLFTLSSKKPEEQPPKLLDQQEKDSILNALEKSLWIQKDAAELLGITPRALNYKIRKYDISHPRWRKNR